MSYNIAVVNFKLPEDFDEASALLKPMVAEDVSVIEPIYQQFHDAITKTYPCLTSLPDEDIQNGVWCMV